MDYYSLDLQIAKEPEGSLNQYRASILENGNIKATNSFELRHDLKLTQKLDKIEEKAVIPFPQPKETIHIELGEMLYNAVFSGGLGGYFNIRLNEAQEENCGLRVSLQFSEDVPEIATLPWEYLYNGEDFLVTRRSILLSRLPLGVKRAELKPLDSILRMLVVISSPDDPRIPPLNTEKEQEIILEAVDNLQKEQKMKVDFTEDATFENIQGYLNEQNYHIVHFTGHGACINGKGHLVFETEDRKARLIDNKILANLFSDLGIRLVVLSSCESAKGSNKEAFSDLASMLLKRKIPAVVAMQYSVLDEVAIKFAQTFYRKIAYGKSVDVALNEARITMKDSEKSNGLDFGTPVLYLSDSNCVQVEEIKPYPAEFKNKHMILHDLQLMKTGFVARNRELRILERSFKSDAKRAAIIHGLGGIGKTVLATRFALKMNDYFDGIFGVKCTSTTRPEDIMTKLNNFLMMKGISNLNQIINKQVPFEKKTSLLVDTLNQLRLLLILDNFEDCLDKDRKDIENSELKTFIQHLLNNIVSKTKFIITTRYDFDPVEGRLPEIIEHISLPELHFPQTNWMMNNYELLADLSIRKKRLIYDIIGGHPWTVGQFAKLASVQCLDSLMMDLKPLRKELIEFTLLDKSFSKLDFETEKLLLYASIYEEAVPIDALSFIVEDNKDRSSSVDEPLNKLVQWGLISKEQEYNQTIYIEHTIVRDFARHKLEEEGFDKKMLLIRAARYYENLTIQTKNIWDILKARDYYYQAEDWENANEIVINTTDYLVRWGYIELAINLLNDTINTTSGVNRTHFEYALAAIYYRLGDLNTALKLYNDIKRNYEERGDDIGVAVVLNSIGIVHQNQGNYEKAVKLYKQSLKIFDELGHKSGIASTLHQLGNINCHQGNHEEALNLYNQSLKISESIDDKSGIASTLHQLGVVNHEQGNYEEAVKLYKQSLKMFEDLGQKSGIASTLHQLGVVNQERGYYEEAIKMYNQSLKQKEELGDRRGVAQTLQAFGTIHYFQGNYEEAMKKYKQSLEIYDYIRDKSGIASTLHQLGVVNQERGYYEEAIKMYNQSLEIEEELENQSGIASTLQALGVINQEQFNYEDAMIMYKQSLEMFKKLCDKGGTASTLCQIGTVYMKLDNIKTAKKIYMQSKKIAEEIGDKRVLAVVLHQLGEINKENSEVLEALETFNQSLRIKKELGDKKGVGITLCSIGNAHYSLGNYEEATKMFNDSVRIFEDLGDKKTIAATLAFLGMTHEAKKEFIFALNAYLKAFSILKEINSQYSQLAAKNILNLRCKLGEDEFNAVLEKVREQCDICLDDIP